MNPKEEPYKLTEQYDEDEKKKEDSPAKVESKKFLKKSFLFWDTKVDEVKYPFLLLIREDNTMETIEGVKRGVFSIQTKEGKKKWIALTPKKMISWIYNNRPHLCWVAYENEMTAYPTDIVHDGETFYDIMSKISMDKKNLESIAEKKMQLQMWLYLALGLAAVLYVLFGTQIGKKILDGITGGGGG